jgi:hypothetical protein
LIAACVVDLSSSMLMFMFIVFSYKEEESHAGGLFLSLSVSRPYS